MQNLLAFPGLNPQLLQSIDETQGGADANSEEIVIMLIKSPSSSDELIAKYSESENSDFRLAVYSRDLPSPWRFLNDRELRDKISEDSGLDQLTLDHLNKYICHDEFIEELYGRREEMLSTFIKKGFASKDLISRCLEIAKNNNDEYMARRIAWSENLDPQAINYLRNYEDNEVRLIINTIRQLPKEWWYLDEWEIIEKLKNEPDLPESVTSILANSEQSMIKQAIATRNLPPDWWNLDEDEKAQRVDQEDLDENFLACLVESSDISESNLRYNIACKNNASEETYIKLREGSFQNYKQNGCSEGVSDKASEQLLIRKLPVEFRDLDENTLVSKIKANEVDIEILTICGEYGSNWLRDAVAKNPNTPARIVEILVDDIRDYIQFSAILHPNCPVNSVNRALNYQGSDYVKNKTRDYAQLRNIDPKLIPLILDSDYQKIAKLIKQGAIDLDSVILLSGSSLEDLRACSVYSDQLPPDIVEKLKLESNYYVAEAFKLARLPVDWIGLEEDEIRDKLKEGDAPNVVYEILSNSDSSSVRALIATSNGVPEAIIEKLMEDEDGEVRFALLERQLPEKWRALDDEQRIEQMQAENIDEEILALLATDTGYSHWQVRVAIASSPSVSLRILQQLVKDSDSDVQNAAKEALRRTGQGCIEISSGPKTYYFGIYQGETNTGSCLLAELQTVEQGDYDVDDGDITDELREELEEGCVGWGPFKDQKLIVWTEEDGDEDIIAVVDIEEAIDNDKVHDCHVCLGYGTKGKHIIGVQSEKGGFNGEAELDIEDFDEDKITFGLVNLADNWFIINSVQYDGEEIEMEGDSTGKGSEYYKFEDDETEYIC